MGRKRLPEHLRTTSIIIRIRWPVYELLESEGNVGKRAVEIIEEYYEKNKHKNSENKNIDET